MGTCSPASFPWLGAHRWVLGPAAGALLAPVAGGRAWSALQVSPRLGTAPGLGHRASWCHHQLSSVLGPACSPACPVSCLALYLAPPVFLSSHSLGVPVSGCWCQLLCPCSQVRVCLTVSLCPSVLCSWTLLRMEWYGFFVSSAHPGPSLPQVRGPEFSLQHCSGQQRRGLSLVPATVPAGPASGSVSPPSRPDEAKELWADVDLVRALSAALSLSTENHFFGGW